MVSTDSSSSSCSKVKSAAGGKPPTSNLTRNADRYIPRKLTNSFIQKMAGIPKIKNEMTRFLRSEITPVHRNETNWKIHSLAKKWQGVLANKNFDLFEGICKVIELDPKFKLPWTSKEVDLAVSSTKKLFEIEFDS